VCVCVCVCVRVCVCNTQYYNRLLTLEIETAVPLSKHGFCVITGLVVVIGDLFARLIKKYRIAQSLHLDLTLKSLN